jgi:Helix-hairpin-helix motif
VWLSLIPMGLGAWTPIYAGVRARRRMWWLLGVLWSVIALAGWVAAIASNGGSAGGLLIILGWAGGAVTSFAIRSDYRRAIGSAASPFDNAMLGARRRLAERNRARRLAREQPALARELGVGRPDLPGAQDAGLIDVNAVPAATLTRLPGIDDALAHQIVDLRDGGEGFSSVEDLGTALDLDAAVVEELRERVVCVPRFDG